MELLAVAVVLMMVISPLAYYLAVKLGTYARLKTERDFEQRYPKARREDSGST